MPEYSIRIEDGAIIAQQGNDLLYFDSVVEIRSFIEQLQDAASTLGSILNNAVLLGPEQFDQTLS